MSSSPGSTRIVNPPDQANPPSPRAWSVGGLYERPSDCPSSVPREPLVELLGKLFGKLNASGLVRVLRVEAPELEIRKMESYKEALTRLTASFSLENMARAGDMNRLARAGHLSARLQSACEAGWRFDHIPALFQIVEDAAGDEELSAHPRDLLGSLRHADPLTLLQHLQSAHGAPAQRAWLHVLEAFVPSHYVFDVRRLTPIVVQMLTSADGKLGRQLVFAPILERMLKQAPEPSFDHAQELIDALAPVLVRELEHARAEDMDGERSLQLLSRLASILFQMFKRATDECGLPLIATLTPILVQSIERVDGERAAHLIVNIAPALGQALTRMGGEHASQIIGLLAPILVQVVERVISEGALSLAPMLAQVLERMDDDQRQQVIAPLTTLLVRTLEQADGERALQTVIDFAPILAQTLKRADECGLRLVESLTPLLVRSFKVMEEGDYDGDYVTRKLIPLLTPLLVQTLKRADGECAMQLLAPLLSIVFTRAFMSGSGYCAGQWGNIWTVDGWRQCMEPLVPILHQTLERMDDARVRQLVTSSTRCGELIHDLVMVLLRGQSARGHEKNCERLQLAGPLAPVLVQLLKQAPAERVRRLMGPSPKDSNFAGIYSHVHEFAPFVWKDVYERALEWEAVTKAERAAEALDEVGKELRAVDRSLAVPGCTVPYAAPMVGMRRRTLTRELVHKAADEAHVIEQKMLKAAITAELAEQELVSARGHIRQLRAVLGALLGSPMPPMLMPPVPAPADVAAPTDVPPLPDAFKSLGVWAASFPPSPVDYPAGGECYVVVLDSNGGTASDGLCTQKLLWEYVNWHRACRGAPRIGRADFDARVPIKVIHVPRQKLLDCGLFTCANGKELARVAHNEPARLLEALASSSKVEWATISNEASVVTQPAVCRSERCCDQRSMAAHLDDAVRPARGLHRLRGRRAFLGPRSTARWPPWKNQQVCSPVDGRPAHHERADGRNKSDAAACARARRGRCAACVHRATAHGAPTEKKRELLDLCFRPPRRRHVLRDLKKKGVLPRHTRRVHGEYADMLIC